MTNVNTAANIIPTGKLNSLEDAIAMANEVERLEATVKVMKAEMKKFVDKNGPIVTNDSIWDYNSTVSWNFTSEQLKNVAQNIVLEGKNPWELLSISAANLKKLGWNDSLLETMGTKKSTTRFSSRKK